MRNNLNIKLFFIFLEVIIMEETMIMDTTAVEVEEATAELATVDYDETGKVEVVTDDNGGINPIVAAGVGLGVTGIVGGLTYMFLKKRKNKKCKNDKKDEPKAEGTTAKKPESEEELNEYLEKLIAETAEVNKRIMELKKTTEEEKEEDSEEE